MMFISDVDGQRRLHTKFWLVSDFISKSLNCNKAGCFAWTLLSIQAVSA